MPSAMSCSIIARIYHHRYPKASGSRLYDAFGDNNQADTKALPWTTVKQTPRLYRRSLQICTPKQAFVQHMQTVEVHHSRFTPECDEVSRPPESTHVQAPKLPARSVVARKPMPPFSVTVWISIVPELTTCLVRSPLGSTCTTNTVQSVQASRH